MRVMRACGRVGCERASASVVSVRARARARVGACVWPEAPSWVAPGREGGEEVRVCVRVLKRGGSGARAANRPSPLRARPHGGPSTRRSTSETAARAQSRKRRKRSISRATHEAVTRGGGNECVAFEDGGIVIGRGVAINEPAAREEGSVLAQSGPDSTAIMARLRLAPTGGTSDPRCTRRPQASRKQARDFDVSDDSVKR
eukprot:4776626-Pleurochrysis_carterae.AAC.2